MTDLKTVERDRAGLTRSRILVFYHFRPGCARLSFYARGGGALCQARTRRHRVGLRRLVRREGDMSDMKRTPRPRGERAASGSWTGACSPIWPYCWRSRRTASFRPPPWARRRAALTSSSAPPLRLSSAISSAPTTAWRPRPARTTPDNSLQVVTTAGIGLFCLLTLLVFRAAALLDPGLAASDSATATLAQFRDFVSGCVGCLIAGPAAKTESKPAIT